MYQLLPSTTMGAATCIKRIADNAFIPFDLANTDYVEYQQWLLQGNTPMPADTPILAVGTVNADTVSVPAGATVDATQLGLGNDKVVLSGNLADYTQSIDQSTGIYTLTRQVGGVTESVKILVSDTDDAVCFADGCIKLNAETDPRLYDGEAFSLLTAEMLVK